VTGYSILNASCFSGGITTTNGTNKVPMLINERVRVPKYFWKAVCDPVLQSSVVFVAKNPTGAENKKHKKGCNPGTKENPRLQTPNLGVIYCYNLDKLKSKIFSKESDFKLPPFSEECMPSARGSFLDQYLNGLQ
jgi:hypothetical protein